MKTKIVNMMLALLPISVAGVPAATAMAPAPMVVVEPIQTMADSPDMDTGSVVETWGVGG